LPTKEKLFVSNDTPYPRDSKGLGGFFVYFLTFLYTVFIRLNPINLNSSVDHDENSEYSGKTRTYWALWIHPMGESIILDSLLIFINIRHVFHSQLRNLG
jgi:hypothetical protein